MIGPCDRCGARGRLREAGTVRTDPSGTRQLCEAGCAPAGPPALPPLLLLGDSPGCSHKFVDSAVCLHCGSHCSDLYLEQLDLDGDGLLVRARQAVRFVQRFGEPQTERGRATIADLRELLGGAP